MIMRIVVLFPAPLGPSKPYSTPGGTSRERPSTAVWPENRFVMRSATRMDVVIGPAGETYRTAASFGGGNHPGEDGPPAGPSTARRGWHREPAPFTPARARP